MHILPISTRIVRVEDDLISFLEESVKNVAEGDVLCITSKILSLCQGRVVLQSEISKSDLIQQEADAVFHSPSPSYNDGVQLTLKDKMLMLSAGIDESNSGESYILYPDNPQKVVMEVWSYFRKKYSLSRFGVLITDSTSTPLRRGCVGRALSWCGFQSTNSYIGKRDLKGKEMRVSEVNVIDSLSAVGVFAMGEGSECTPLAIIRDAPKIQFTDRPPPPQEIDHFYIKLKDDLYAPLFDRESWTTGV